MYIVNGIFENIFQILFTIKIMMRLCALGVKSSVERFIIIGYYVSRRVLEEKMWLLRFSNANRVFFRLGRNKTILFYGEKFIWSFESVERKISIITCLVGERYIILNKMNYCKIVIQLFNSNKGDLRSDLSDVEIGRRDFIQRLTWIK